MKIKVKKINRILSELGLNLKTDKPLSKGQFIILLKNKKIKDDKIKNILESV